MAGLAAWGGRSAEDKEGVGAKGRGGRAGVAREGWQAGAARGILLGRVVVRRAEIVLVLAQHRA